MRYARYFLPPLKKHYPNTFTSLLQQVAGKFAVTGPAARPVTRSGNPVDKRLDFSACFLAMILVLEEQGETFEHIRLICLEVAYEYVRPKNKVQQWLKRLPPKLLHTGFARFFLKILNRKISVLRHPDGFVARVITGKEETFGFGYGVDILECGICKQFRKYGAEKYVSILCEVDKITTGLAGLELIRNGTIALGAPVCDFRFKKMK